MSKQDKEGKIQFVFVNVEGDQTTLQEALRQVGNVLHRGMNPPQSRTFITVPVPKNLDNGKNDTSNDEQVYEVQFEEEQDNFTENVTVAPPPANKPKRERKAPPIPALLKDFDPNDAEVTLEDFVNQKNTSTQINKYLVIGAWFKKYKNTDEIGTSHIYTTFQLFKWQAPDDMAQPFRNMKHNNSYFDNGSKTGLWKITIVGLNEVDKMNSTKSEE